MGRNICYSCIGRGRSRHSLRDWFVGGLIARSFLSSGATLAAWRRLSRSFAVAREAQGQIPNPVSARASPRLSEAGGSGACFSHRDTGPGDNHAPNTRHAQIVRVHNHNSRATTGLTPRRSRPAPQRHRLELRSRRVELRSRCCIDRSRRHISRGSVSVSVGWSSIIVERSRISVAVAGRHIDLGRRSAR